jgi:hypothetical protein
MSAQQDAGPFSYSPANTLVHHIWTDPNAATPVIYKDISLGAITSSPIEDNGILIEFDFTINPNESNENKGIIQFISDNSLFVFNPVIAFYYTNKSAFVRRWSKEDSCYDYKLYDQLFESTEGTYKMKFYVSARFILIVSKKIGTNNNYISPLLFGLNVPGVNLMNEYRNLDNGAHIIVGEDINRSPYISNLKVYSFSLHSLLEDIHENFN